MLKIDKENSAPASTSETTTPYNEQGARPKEKSSSRKEPTSSSNRGDNSKGLTLGSRSVASFPSLIYMVPAKIHAWSLELTQLRKTPASYENYKKRGSNSID